MIHFEGNPRNTPMRYGPTNRSRVLIPLTWSHPQIEGTRALQRCFDFLVAVFILYFSSAGQGIQRQHHLETETLLSQWCFDAKPHQMYQVTMTPRLRLSEIRSAGSCVCLNVKSEGKSGWSCLWRFEKTTWFPCSKTLIFHGSCSNYWSFMLLLSFLIAIPDGTQKR